jgi:ABC-type amino acid transport substrate-binding protein
MPTQSASIRLLIGLLIAAWFGMASAEQVLLTGNEARAPKMFKRGDGSAHGVLVEVMRYVGQETGLNFVYVLYPWARAYATAQDGETGIIGISRTREREAIFDFSEEPVFVDDLVLVVKAGNEFPFRTPEDLKGRRIGVCNNCSYGETYERAVKDKLFEPVPGNRISGQLTMLLNGRLDAVLVPVGRAGLEEALRDDSAHVNLLQERHKFAILPRPFTRDPNYVAFAKSMNKRDLLRRIDQALKKGYDSGAIPARIDAYIASRQ